ncbi:uracil-DNA glycosylase [Sphingomonas sabuli]|uniref:Uracil-DNA glycosylase n=1 Tax=Sphingomonas sabuli TaxID=2764186 RepID=A0A7G9L1I2_9SPHN|nr:uracil-DNA glycosylase [Sphingomonas sabuli]QNM82481.1 uracil-DNA glycosylase [Sphingomonas sabuli]
MATPLWAIPQDWRDALADDLAEPYVADLRRFLDRQQAAGRTVHPDGPSIFRALELTPLDSVRAVILGQDPYHGPGQAHGLSFSVPPGVPPPPSLKNIFKELGSDLGLPTPAHGLLDHWARQGVLLLNSVLTVENGQAGSHRNQGWERLTDAIVRLVSDRAEPSAFLLWGSPAQRKAALVDRTRHLVLEAPHPSPLSAYRGFFGCRHFSRTNAFLEASGRPPIDWALPDCAPPA